MQKGSYLTNRVTIDRFDDEKFDERFRVYRLLFKGWKERNNSVLLLRKSVSGILSVKYLSYVGGEDNKAMFLLCKSDCSEEEIRNCFSEKISEDNPQIKSLRGRDMKSNHPDVLVELLCIYAVSKHDSESNGYSNIEGSLYLLDRNRGKNSDYVRTLNIRFGLNNDDEFGKITVSIDATGFSKLYLCDGKDIANLTKYVIKDNKMDYLSNSQLGKKKEIYVKHSFENANKKRWPFFSMESLNKLEESKAGRLDQLFEVFNRKYADMMSISLTPTDRFSNDYFIGNSNRGDLQKTLDSILKNEKFAIVDFSENRDEFEWFLNECKGRITNVEESPSVVHGAMNIVVVTSKKKDEKHFLYHDKAVQHTSIESIKEVHRKVEEAEKRKKQKEENGSAGKRGTPDPFSSFFAMVIINVKIKKDILCNSISFADWKEYRPNEGCWHFITRVLVHYGDDRYLKYGDMVDMQIDHDGRCQYFIYHSQTEVPEDFVMIWSEFEARRDEGKELIGVVSDGENSFGYYFKNDLQIMPSVGECSEYLTGLPVDANGKINNKGKKSKNMRVLYSACLDIHVTDWKNGRCYYSSGIPGNGINGLNFNKARIREIRILNGKEKLPCAFFKMLTVSFVKYNMQTVIPYPFKYLKEFIMMNDLDKSLDPVIKKHRSSIITEFE